MTAGIPPTVTNAAEELEALVSLVRRLSVASAEATRLAVEVQARIPAFAIAGATGAQAAPTATATAAHTGTANAANQSDADPPSFVRLAPRNPAQIEADFPDGSGEVFYVVLIGREPGRVPHPANDQCNGVPNQFKEKRKTRREALAYYREAYFAPGGDGVQKWVEA
ncbi:hypothetical protein B0H16DRAFT_1469181 [Mycena metata]|uniref:Uncharacterized protein n=1 Tax=Mycena metata TaxID=1033252 RepID=A0AAD7HYS8_9AGAR|nr:hypothetical protein B0H16DRAFT_1469181 [Mycena metata]